MNGSFHGTLLRCVLICSLIGTARAEERDGDRWPGPPGEPRIYKHSDGVPRALELFFPPDHDPARKVPGLILFHGGGWKGGSLAQFRAACAYFASRGLVCAAAEYRMLKNKEAEELPAGESRKRVCITDAKSAIRWFKQHAGELGVDPEKIIAGGGSAGGHISALATLNPGLNDPVDPLDLDTSVVAYLWFNPAFEPDDKHDSEVDLLQFAGRNLPPAIVFFGSRDPWFKHWELVAEHLRRVESPRVEVLIASGEKHGFFNHEPWQSAALVEADRFLAGLGLLEGEPTRKVPEPGAAFERRNQ
jgi:acetyl esterase